MYQLYMGANSAKSLTENGKMRRLIFIISTEIIHTKGSCYTGRQTGKLPTLTKLDMIITT